MDVECADMRWLSVVKPCSVRLYHCDPQLHQRISVCVECVSKSLLHPNIVFKSEKPSKSSLFPGKIFKSKKPSKSSLYPGKIFKGKPEPDWTCVTVPTDKMLISSKLPGRVFTGHTKPQKSWVDCVVPVDKPSRSSSRPGMIFKASYTVADKLRFKASVTVTPVQKPSVSKTVKRFNCLICKTFMEDSRTAIKRHVEQNHGMFTCSNAHCVAGFRSQNAHDIHSAVHMRKVCMCPVCKARFHHRYALECHVVVHEKCHKFRCSRCSRKYFCSQDLKEHMDTAHSGASFTCTQCSYSGKSKRALRQHEKLHKPPTLSCSKCSKQFHW